MRSSLVGSRDDLKPKNIRLCRLLNLHKIASWRDDERTKNRRSAGSEPWGQMTRMVAHCSLTTTNKGRRNTTQTAYHASAAASRWGPAKSPQRKQQTHGLWFSRKAARLACKSMGWTVPSRDGVNPSLGFIFVRGPVRTTCAAEGRRRPRGAWWSGPVVGAGESSEDKGCLARCMIVSSIGSRIRSCQVLVLGAGAAWPGGVPKGEGTGVEVYCQCRVAASAQSLRPVS